MSSSYYSSFVYVQFLNPSKFTVITLCVLHKPMGGSQYNEEIPGGGSEGYHVLKVPHTMHCGFQF